MNIFHLQIFSGKNTSQKMNTLLRLKEYTEHEGITITSIEREIGVSKGSIARQLKSGKAIGVDKVENILLIHSDINPTWLLTGKGEMLLKEEAIYSDKANEEVEHYSIEKTDTIPNGAIPYWNLPVSAGHSVEEIIGSSKPSGYVKDLPGIDVAENILPVTGMSMEPEISNGAIIGVKKMNNWESLNTERVYMIITHDDRMIKRIEPDEEDNEVIWCVSPNYKRFKVFKSDIIEIQRVCFVYNPK